jgi:hypothetical protein
MTCDAIEVSGQAHQRLSDAQSIRGAEAGFF